jgi:hypothetical protein
MFYRFDTNAPAFPRPLWPRPPQRPWPSAPAPIRVKASRSYTQPRQFFHPHSRTQTLPMGCGARELSSGL